MEIAKRVISGILQKNYQVGEIDDAIFIPLIKAGIEDSGSEDTQKALYDHALTEFINIWIEFAKEYEGVNFDLEYERKEAKEAFLAYWNQSEF